MTKKWSQKECFDRYGVKPANPRWSWSGKSADGKTVAVTLWKDRFEKGIDLYRWSASPGEAGRQLRPGHTELIRNLAWARDNCDGEVSIIIATAVDPNANPRTISECFPRTDFRMRVVGLDEASGEFVLERIKP